MELEGTDKSSKKPRRFTMEHRWGQRVDCHVYAGISSGADTLGAGRLRDVSMSGSICALLGCTTRCTVSTGSLCHRTR
jgi:hypothetical protein